MQCHLVLSLRSSDSLSRVRANAVSKENMDNYFSQLKETLADSNLLENQHTSITRMSQQCHWTASS